MILIIWNQVVEVCVFTPPVYFACCLHVLFPYFLLRPVACFVISSHTLMSQFFRIGPISLSNLVNLAVRLSPQGFQLLEITLTLSHSMPQHWVGLEGGGAEGLYVGVSGGGDRSVWVGGSYRPFDIIMVHYSSESSLCAAASYTRGQGEYHLALIEASGALSGGPLSSLALP